MGPTQGDYGTRRRRLRVRASALKLRLLVPAPFRSTINLHWNGGGSEPPSGALFTPHSTGRRPLRHRRYVEINGDNDAPTAVKQRGPADWRRGTADRCREAAEATWLEAHQPPDRRHRHVTATQHGAVRGEN